MKQSRWVCLMLLVAFSVSSLLCAIVQVQASTGNILINVTSRPSPDVTIEVGKPLSLYFRDVTWSGGQVDLYLSTDGYSNRSEGDISFGPSFTVAKIRASAVDTTTYEGYSVGNDWINGTIPKTLGIPGGDYYVKAFDGQTASVAVTDRSMRIVATFEVVPSSGPAQAAIELRGYGLPANDYANLSWSKDELTWTTIEDLVHAGGTGQFTYATVAHDLGEVLPMGLRPEGNSTVAYRLIVNGTGQALLGTFDEYRRGLKQVHSLGLADVTAPSGSLFGNNTNFFVHGLYVKVKSNLTIAGKWFHPGTVRILWDDETIGTAPVDEEGFFNTTVTVPVTLPGLHNVAVRDATTNFILRVDCFEAYDVTPPKADAGPDRTVDQDEVVVFDGSGSKDDIGILSYVWTFVDVTPKTLKGVNPPYSFADPGVYVITLEVSDVAGNSDTDTVTVTVRDATPPIAEAGVDQTVEEDTIVTLDGSQSTDNVEIATYSWVFVDVTPKILEGITATYNFSAPGVYMITLNVTDASENWDTDTVTISVLDITDPIAEAGLDQTIAKNTSVAFDAGNSSDNVGIVSYEWDFGDGSRGTGLAADHLYTDVGYYTATLSVRDAAGNRGTDSVTITVVVDTDGDGIPDPLDPDDDGDGMPDSWETANGLDPLDAADASLDQDGDRLTNHEEYEQGTDPRNYFSPLPFWVIAVAVVAVIGVAAAAIALLLRKGRGIG